jgi:hypothetical protein
MRTERFAVGRSAVAVRHLVQADGEVDYLARLDGAVEHVGQQFVDIGTGRSDPTPADPLGAPGAAGRAPVCSQRGEVEQVRPARPRRAAARGRARPAYSRRPRRDRPAQGGCSNRCSFGLAAPPPRGAGRERAGCRRMRRGQAGLLGSDPGLAGGEELACLVPVVHDHYARCLLPAVGGSVITWNRGPCQAQADPALSWRCSLWWGQTRCFALVGERLP